MADIDSWQMVFEKACELIDAVLHEQPKDEIDALDIEEQVVNMTRAIAQDEVQPRSDWSVLIKSANKGAKLDEAIDLHFDIALRQAIYVRILFEHEMDKIKENITETLQPGKLRRVGEDMLTAFACAQQHATAWRLLRDVRDKSYEMRSAKAVQAKQEVKEEKEILLRGLVVWALKEFRPVGDWKGDVRAGQIISGHLKSLIKDYKLPVESDEDVLSEEVRKMIHRDPRVRKAYNENAKSPLEEPLKMRKIDVVTVFK